GRRIGVKGKPGRRDRFSVTEAIDEVAPGSGPIAVTARIFDIAPGEWHVTAAPVGGVNRPGIARSRRRSSLPSASSSGATAFAPVIRVRAPGAHIGVWPAMVGFGTAI